jgi:hypothetical protein
MRYGILLLLVCAISRIQMRFIEEIDGVHLPRLRQFQQEAEQNIVEAQRQIARGGPQSFYPAVERAPKSSVAIILRSLLCAAGSVEVTACV